MLVEMKVTDFLSELASDSPAPGGGSVAALSGALGAGLLAMVCRLSIGRKDSAPHDEELKRVMDQADETRLRLIRLIDEDTEAFNRVMASFKMPKGTDEEKSARSRAIQAAYQLAVETPMEVLTACGNLLNKARDIVDKSNVNTMSDLGVSVQMAFAGLQGAFMNVQINLPAIKDAEFASQSRERASVILNDATDIKLKMDAVLADKLA